MALRHPPANHRLYSIETAGWTCKVLASEAARAAFDGLRSLAHKPARKADRWGPGKPAERVAFDAKAKSLHLHVQVRVATAEETRAFLAKGTIQPRPRSVLERQAQGEVA